jgi:hypothetical protein
MSHALTAQTPGTAFRRLVERALYDPESRSVTVGLTAVLVVHLLILLLSPFLFRTDAIEPTLRKASSTRQFNIEIAPDAFAIPVKPVTPTKFIEANPDAPDKVPTDTTNFSSKNQITEQEKPQANQHNDKPKLDGKKDIQSNQTVDGRLQKPVDSTPVPQTVQAAAKTVSAPKQEQDPLAGFDQSKASDDGFGSNNGKVASAKPMPDKVEGAKDAPQVVGAESQYPSIDPKRPRARPVLEKQQTRPAVFEDNQFGTENIGPAAISAKWSEYGAYLHKMFEAIQVEWDRININSATYPPSGSTVTVKFILDSKGQISDIVEVETTSSEQGKQNCLTALTAPAPYGEWSEEMKAVLGASQEMTVVFYYQ